MTELENAARMALEALQKAVPKDAKQAREQLDAIAALTQALATTERKGEPVAYFVTWPGDPVGMRRFYGADEWEASRKTVEYFGGVSRPLIFGDTSPQVPEDADPLQGAVNWLCEARMDVSVDLIQHKLHIGYNRAKRLFDAARKGE